MASIGNQIKARKRQSQQVRPIRTHFFEPLEPRLLLSADWMGQAALGSLAAPPDDRATAVILDQPQKSDGPAASDAVVGTTSLEVTPLATTVYWDGGGDGTSWQDPLNWSGNVVPGPTNDVVINLAGSNPTIRFTAAAGARTVRSLRCNETFALSGGGLTVSGGASQFTANFSLTGGTLAATGIGTTLTTSTVSGPLITMTGGTVTASAGAIITFPTVTSLKDVNLYASGGGKIYFPKATSYVDNGYGQTIQASGAGSRIELPKLTSLKGGDTTNTQATALTGGTVVLAGNILPGVTLTASGASALINLVNAPGVTTPQWTLTDVNLTASNGGKIQASSVKSYVDNGYGQTIQASGASSRIELPGLTTLKGGDTTNTQVTALTGGTVVLAGKISGRATLTASGGALDLLRVTALTNSSTTTITINASNGATVSLPAAITTLTDVNLYASSGGKIQGPYVKSYVDNGYGQTIQASGTGSRVELAGLTLFNGGDTTSTQVTALTGGTVVLAGNILPGVTLTASGASALINLVNAAGATTPQWTLTDVNLTASNGGKIQGASVKSYVDNGYGQTIQASGANSRIELPGLTTLKGGDTTNTQATALTGGTVVLAGRISGRATLTASGGVLDLSRVTALTTSSTTNITINASNGSTVSLPAAVTILIDVNLYASSGGKIQGPYVKSYVDNGYGQTIQASGTGSRIDLRNLTSLKGGDTTATQVTALNWGTIVLAGTISAQTTLTASGVGSMIDGTRTNGAGVTALTDVNLTASGGGVLLLAAATYRDNGYGQTIQASGAGSRIDLGRLTDFKGADITNTQVTALNAGVIVLSGRVSGRVTFTQSGGGTIIRGPSAPEVSVFGNLLAISDGDTTPSTTDGTNFGSVARGRTPISRTFTVRNDSLVTLTLGTGTLPRVIVPAGFTLTDDLVASLAPGASDTFTVRLNTTMAGTWSGNISFANNDKDGGDLVENPFNFRITGIVTV